MSAMPPCGVPRPRRPPLVRPDSRPKAADPDKQVEEAAEQLAEVMEERRADGRWSAPDGMSSHSMASVRLLQRRALLTSVEGGPRIFIVGNADRLVPQESSPEAANALLKLLEEPPANAYFVLTTEDPRRVLPTIRSRAVPMRLAPVSDGDVRTALEQEKRPLTGTADWSTQVKAMPTARRYALVSPWDVSRVVAELSALVFALRNHPENPYGTPVSGVGATGFEPVTSAV